MRTISRRRRSEAVKVQEVLTRRRRKRGVSASWWAGLLCAGRSSWKDAEVLALGTLVASLPSSTRLSPNHKLILDELNAREV